MGKPKNYALEDEVIVIESYELYSLDIMTDCVLDTFLKIGLRDDDEPNEIELEAGLSAVPNIRHKKEREGYRGVC
ncbi:MAG: hypothetical protein E7350_03640 [Clostridiales bacterium]|nr:hypothetical protein [Clostridiales bacterium]